MAKQKGIIKLEGTIGDVTFFKTADGYLAREHAPLSATRIATDPAFQRTRENNAEFKRAGLAGRVLRTAIRNVAQNAKDRRLVSRLHTELLKVIQADSTSLRGQRNIIDGEAELLEGFDCNNNAKLASTLFVPYTGTIDRVTGKLSINMPAFVPVDSITAPAGTTHYNLVAMGAEINFEQELYQTDSKETGVQPWSAVPQAALQMQLTLPANSVHPLFLLLSVQFYQLVNGKQYSLKNGSYNALNIIKVSGV